MENHCRLVVDTVDFCAGKGKNQLSSLMMMSVKPFIDEDTNIGTVILHRLNNSNCFVHVPSKGAETAYGTAGDDF